MFAVRYHFARRMRRALWFAFRRHREGGGGIVRPVAGGTFRGR
jgi:hypothetical protein